MHPIPQVYGEAWLQVSTGKKHKDLEFHLENLGLLDFWFNIRGGIISSLTLMGEDIFG